MPASLSWPPLELMQPGSAYPRAEVSLGSHLAKVIDDSGDEIDALGHALMVMERDCTDYRAQFANLLKDADQALAANPDEDVNSFTSDRDQAPSWGDFVSAAGTCFQSLNNETNQQNRTASQLAQIMPAFKEYADTLPESPKNTEIDELMAQQGEQNLLEQQGINSDNARFTATAHDLETSPISLADSRQYWIKSRLILDFVVPINGKGIMRRNYELDKRMVSQLNLVFNLQK